MGSSRIISPRPGPWLLEDQRPRNVEPRSKRPLPPALAGGGAGDAKWRHSHLCRCGLCQERPSSALEVGSFVVGESGLCRPSTTPASLSGSLAGSLASPGPSQQFSYLQPFDVPLAWEVGSSPISSVMSAPLVPRRSRSGTPDMAFRSRMVFGAWAPAQDRSMATAVVRLQGRLERSKRQLRKEAMQEAKAKLYADIEATRQEEEEREREERRAKEIIALRMASLWRARQRWKALLKEKEEVQRASMKIQSLFRGHKVRSSIDEIKCSPPEEDETVLYVNSDFDGSGSDNESSFGKGSVKGKSSRTPRKRGEAAEITDFEVTPKHIPEVWRPGVELPAVGIETLWEILASIGRGQICTALCALDFVNQFAAVRKTGLEPLRQAVVNKWIDYSQDGDVSEDIYPRQAAAVLVHVKTYRDTGLDRQTLLDVTGDVYDPCGELLPDFQDLGVDHHTEFNLRVFKKTVSSLASLLCIKESWLIAHLVWFNTKQFELVADLGFKILSKTFHKLQGPLKFTQTDFYRLCYAWHIVDPKGRKGIRTSSLPTIFAKTLQRMPSLFQKRISSRPKIRGHSGKLEVEDTKNRTSIKGWTEFSILLQMLYNAMPIGVFSSPLVMCLEGIRRSVEKEKEREVPKAPIPLQRDKNMESGKSLPNSEESKNRGEPTNWA